MTAEDDADARDDVVEQPPKIRRTSYSSYPRHNVRLSTGFAAWALAASIIIGLILALAIVIEKFSHFY